MGEESKGFADELDDSYFFLEQMCRSSIICWDGKDLEGVYYREGSREMNSEIINFENFKFQMPARHLNGDVK